MTPKNLNPIQLGLVSITFRSLSALEILRMTSECGLHGIEWGSDIHLLPGDIKTAEMIRKKSDELSLKTLSYASYYKAGFHDPSDFDLVLKTALALGTSRIRVWAGNQSSATLSPAAKKKIREDLLRIADLATALSIEIGVEYHCETYTDTVDSTEELFLSLDHSPIFSYWQPPLQSIPEQNLQEIQRLGRWIKMVHCFHWKWQEEQHQIHRFPLKEGVPIWRLYLNALKQETSVDTLSLEFVSNDSPQQLTQDCKTLRTLLPL